MATNSPDTERDFRTSNVGRTDDQRDVSRNPDANPDPITGAPRSHPVGTGVGALAGGAAGVGGAIAAGAAMGTVAGPVGTAIGAVAGAVVGGLIGKEVAEDVNPSVEHEYWRNNYASRNYVKPGTSYDEYGPAYQYGWESRSRHQGKNFTEVESELGREWNRAKQNSSLGWEHAKLAARDSWDRVSSRAGTGTASTTTVGYNTGSASASNATSEVNDLIETLKDGQNGFQDASHNLQDPSIKAQFMEFAKQRARFAAELQTAVMQMGHTPENSGSATAAMHRGWINLKNALGGGDQSILNEAERGEDVAVRAYQKALQAQLPGNIMSIVQRQFTEVKQAHDQVRNLRDARRS